MIYTFKKVSQEDNLAQVAELIYLTDEYIYPDLFGSLENAKIILPLLIVNKKSVFYMENLYLAKQNDEIVGIGMLHKHTVNWDSGVVALAFLETKIPFPESFGAADNYFNAVYNFLSAGINVCNICVHIEHRRKGVGKFIVKRLIEMSGKADIVLSVIADNIAAVELYKKFGFKIVYTYDDYGGYNKPLVKCHSMLRQFSDL